MTLTIDWKEFQASLNNYADKGLKIQEANKQNRNPDNYEELKTECSEWSEEVIKYLKSAFDIEQNEFVRDFKHTTSVRYQMTGVKKDTHNLLKDQLNTVSLKVQALKGYIKILSISDAIIKPNEIDLEARRNFATDDILDFTLDKLYDLYDDYYHSIQAILRGNGLELKRNGEERELAKTLEDYGFVNLTYAGDVLAQLTIEGKRHVEEKRNSMLSSHNYINQAKGDYEINDVNAKLNDLTRRAEDYYNVTKSDIIKSKVNTTGNINLFAEWFLESRDLFSQYFDSNDKNYAEFTSFDTSGNGYVLSSKFSTLYPLFKILKNKILDKKLIEKTITRTMNNKGFIIHGHDDAKKLEVARFLEKDLNKEAIILHEMPNKGKTVIEKFESNSEVDFAIALWTADDLGKSKKEGELSTRSRQNVIFETGYFIGKLGRERVIILFESGVEKPSDYAGVVYISLSGNWKYELQKEVNSIYS